ncbi:hypothetical protein Zmor_021475 [Zophobas morio]|uniref:Uncharacterized protein n=1 Tax=Zophobas morio TaxID=2755281 RepID=A0AA38I8P3_9CUCU|nr:hypothetical protein Zmor_021475 [Zophobas morio]
MGMFLLQTRYCPTSIKKRALCMGNTLLEMLSFDAFGRLMNFPCLVKQIIMDRRCLHCALLWFSNRQRDDRALKAAVIDCSINRKGRRSPSYQFKQNG